MTVRMSGTSPYPVKPMMDHVMEIKRPLEGIRAGAVEELFKGVKDFSNLMRTEAGQTVIRMSDMKIDGKEAISADKWNHYVAENFPHVQAKPVQNGILLVDAMNSLTTYIVQEQTAQKTEERTALEAKSQENGGDGTRPDVGI